jgi:DNA mismatch repair protein MSH3
MAIADATFQHLVEKIQCRTLFITHYPLVATKLCRKFPLHVQNLHMNYNAEEGIDGIRRVVFLYKLVPGLATGISCC